MIIEVTVNTIWQGKVAIRGQYVRDAIKTNQDLIIYHAHGSMRIPNHKLYDKLAAKSDKKFGDRYRKLKPDFLYYFNWKPDVEQGALV